MHDILNAGVRSISAECFASSAMLETFLLAIFNGWSLKDDQNEIEAHFKIPQKIMEAFDYYYWGHTETFKVDYVTKNGIVKDPLPSSCEDATWEARYSNQTILDLWTHWILSGLPRKINLRASFTFWETLSKQSSFIPRTSTKILLSAKLADCCSRGLKGSVNINLTPFEISLVLVASSRCFPNSMRLLRRYYSRQTSFTNLRSANRLEVARRSKQRKRLVRPTTFLVGRKRVIGTLPSGGSQRDSRRPSGAHDNAGRTWGCTWRMVARWREKESATDEHLRRGVSPMDIKTQAMGHSWVE